ncbi:MAG: endo-1,4-beta-xylanase, partial [Oscillospiraceae bacterium]|nr:endo-1,4-beta-xylanase [Oscillospiraceae bacterium]
MKQIPIMQHYLEQKEETDARIKLGIEQNRKGYATLRLQTPNGRPLCRTPVHAVLRRHEFKHGANLFMLDEFESADKNQRYREQFSQLFNLATLPFYWKDLEPRQGQPRFAEDSPRVYRRPAPDLCLDYCREHDIEPKLHCLNYVPFTPDWVPDDIRQTRFLLEKRFAEIAARYSRTIPGHEVINETLCACKRRFFQQPDLVEWSFKLAEKYFPGNELIINECAGIYQHETQGNRMPYYLLIQRALEHGARIDTIGMQCHWFFPIDYEQGLIDQDRGDAYLNPANIYSVMDRLAAFGKPLQITEITIPAFANKPAFEALQAQLLKLYYSIWFSHPAMEAIIYWNLVDGYAAWTEPGDISSGENLYYGGLLRF